MILGALIAFVMTANVQAKNVVTSDCLINQVQQNEDQQQVSDQTQLNIDQNDQIEQNEQDINVQNNEDINNNQSETCQSSQQQIQNNGDDSQQQINVQQNQNSGEQVNKNDQVIHSVSHSIKPNKQETVTENKVLQEVPHQSNNASLKKIVVQNHGIHQTNHLNTPHKTNSKVLLNDSTQSSGSNVKAISAIKSSSTMANNMIHTNKVRITKKVPQNNIKKATQQNTMPQLGDNNSKMTLWGVILLVMASVFTMLGLVKRRYYK